MALVEVSVHGTTGTICFADRAKHNALSSQLLVELVAGLESLRECGVQVVVLRAPLGAKTWSSGHNVAELPANDGDPPIHDDTLQRAIRAIRRFSSPVIALIEGGVWGAACELVVSCDIAVASETATFAITPAKLGVPYNVARTISMMHTLSLSVLKEMIFLGTPLSAARACAIGLVNRVVPAIELDSAVTEITSEMVSTAPLTIALLKEQLHFLAEATTLSPAIFEHLQRLEREIYHSNDYQEGLRAFFEKRRPNFTGH